MLPNGSAERTPYWIFDRRKLPHPPCPVLHRLLRGNGNRCRNRDESARVIGSVLMCAHTSDCPGSRRDTNGHVVCRGYACLPIGSHIVGITSRCAETDIEECLTRQV